MDVAIEDTCPGCVGQFDLDLSPAAFDRLDRPEVGKIQVEWEFVGEVGVTTGPFAGAVSAAGMNLFLLSTAIEAACCARRRRPLAKKAAL